MENRALSSRVQRILLKGVRACYLIRDRRTALVDCGLPSDADALREGLESAGVSASQIDLLLLTHVHADHGGGAGLLARENPSMEIVVHAAGASHLRDPERLNRAVRSAYGKRWEQAGAMTPVAASNPISTPGAGAQLDLGETKITIFDTPGHCKHHLVFYNEGLSQLYCGDALGSRYEGLPGFILTPPSDYDPDDAKQSIRKLERLRPEQLMFAHNGPLRPTRGFYDELCDQHDRWVNVVRELVSQSPEAGREELLVGFLDAMPELKKYPSQFFSFGLSISGIRNYLLRKVGA